MLLSHTGFTVDVQLAVGMDRLFFEGVTKPCNVDLSPLVRPVENFDQQVQRYTFSCRVAVGLVRTTQCFELLYSTTLVSGYAQSKSDDNNELRPLAMLRQATYTNVLRRPQIQHW